MFNSGYKQVCEEYRKIIATLQAEKTDLWNRLTARNIAELRLLQDAFETQDVIKNDLPLYTEEDTQDYMVGEIVSGGSEIPTEE